MLTPDDVHHHRAPDVLAQRGRTLQAAWALHPERFGGPRHPETRPASRSRLDQPTRHFHNRRNESVNRNRRCLKVVKPKCTKSDFRRVLRYVDEAILERMAERLAARPELLDARRESVEHPFGSIKQWMGQGAFLTRRLENVRGEFSITALAYNIRRAISLVGVPALIAAARA